MRRLLPPLLAALLALCGAPLGCASPPPKPDGAESFLPFARVDVGGVPLERHMRRRAALLVAGSKVTTTEDGVRVSAEGGGPAAAIARDGYLLTAAHCVDVTTTSLHVYLYDDETWYAKARVVWRGDRTKNALQDLAVVKVDVPLPAAFAWSRPGDVREGTELVGVLYERGGASYLPRVAGGRTLAPPEPVEGPRAPSAPSITAIVHDVPVGSQGGGAAIATRTGRLVGIHIGTVEGDLGIALYPDPQWLAALLEADRRREEAARVGR